MRQLRRVYDDVAAEPLPADLMNLLDQLGSNKPTDPDEGNKGS